MINLFLLAYSIILKFVVRAVARISALFSDRVRSQIAGRDRIYKSEYRVLLARLRRQHKNCVVFFCSSAGEYEQAKPIIRRLQNVGVFSHVFFFSSSGVMFAKSRSEDMSYSLAPWDSVWNWGQYFSVLNPQAAVIIRHEFWPGFMCSVAKWCPLYVVDAVPPSQISYEPKWKTLISSKWKKFLIERTKAHVFTADHFGTSYYCDAVGVDGERLHQIGDSKYDRVFERVLELRRSENLLTRQPFSSWSTIDSPIIVAGSVYLEDLEVILKAYRMLGNKSIRMVIVPHHVSNDNISDMADLIQSNSMSFELLSDLEILSLDRKVSGCQIVLVDSIGRLFELYGIASLAFIGGAMHAKVHNVLEPAAWGVPISSGPMVSNSQEAQHFLKRGLLEIIDSPDQLCQTWVKQLKNFDQISQDLLQEVKILSGASQRFVETLKQVLGIVSDSEFEIGK